MNTWLLSFLGISLIFLGIWETFMAVLHPRAVTGPVTSVINRGSHRPSLHCFRFAEPPFCAGLRSDVSNVVSEFIGAEKLHIVERKVRNSLTPREVLMKLDHLNSVVLSP